MKIAKLAVFCGAAASWTGYPSGRTRSFFQVLPATGLTISRLAVGLENESQARKGSTQIVQNLWAVAMTSQ